MRTCRCPHPVVVAKRTHEKAADANKSAGAHKAAGASADPNAPTATSIVQKAEQIRKDRIRQLQPLPPIPASAVSPDIRSIKIPDDMWSKGLDTIRTFCQDAWENKQLRGQGSFGSVYTTCDKSKTPPDCGTWVIKRVIWTPPGGLDKASQDEHVDFITKSFLRETYILRRLRGTKTAPELKDAWRCGDSFYMILEAFDRDVDAQGRLNWEQAITNWQGLTGEQREAMRAINYFVGGGLFIPLPMLLRLLDACIIAQHNGITLGDAKPDNFLYRVKDGQIRATDFNLSGDFVTFTPMQGWTFNLSCKTGDLPDIPAVRQYMNIWQILAFFHHVPVFTTAPENPQKLCVVTNIPSPDGPYYIPVNARKELDDMCPSLDSYRLPRWAMYILRSFPNLYNPGAATSVPFVLRDIAPERRPLPFSPPLQQRQTASPLRFG